MNLAGFMHIYSGAITRVLAVCRRVAVVALALMVVIILLQVWFRYVLNNSLAWPDEAARFCMLWMTGLFAPSAYRWGSFVSIDIIKDRLGPRVGGILNTAILLLALAVLLVALSFATKHIDKGWLFNSGSLKIPLDWIGLQMVRVKLAWMYMSVPLGFVMMVFVNVEMLIKQVHTLIDPEIDYGPPPDMIVTVTE